jgi:hypothetical protein
MQESDAGGATLWANMLVGFVNPVNVLQVTNAIYHISGATIQMDYVYIPSLKLGEVASFTYLEPSICRGKLVVRSSDGALMFCDGAAWKEVKFV